MSQIAAYTRISTPEQNLARQIKNLLPYIDTTFDGVTIKRSYKDVAKYVADPDTSDDPIPLANGDVTLFYDRMTGTNTDRDGYRDMMQTVEEDDVEAVVSDAVSRVSRTLRDLDKTADRLVEDHRTELHLLKEGFRLKPDHEDPFQKAMFRLLGIFAELEADLAQLRAKEGLQARIESDDYHHGPAPLGFEKKNGALVPAPEYDHIAIALESVDKGELSKRKAAKQLGTSRRTINRSLNERRELYGL